MQDLYKKIYADPKFHEFEKHRSRFTWLLAFIVMSAYFSFILVIAFFSQLFAVPVIAGQVMTWGIPAGVFIICLSFCLTGVYVFYANKKFDRDIQNIINDAKQNDTR